MKKPKLLMFILNFFNIKDGSQSKDKSCLFLNKLFNFNFVLPSYKLSVHHAVLLSHWSILRYAGRRKGSAHKKCIAHMVKENIPVNGPHKGK